VSWPYLSRRTPPPHSYDKANLFSLDQTLRASVGSQKYEEGAGPPCVKIPSQHATPPQVLLQHICHSRSDGWCVITGVFQRSLILCIPPLKVAQRNCNRHGLIWLRVTSCQCSTVTMALSHTVSDINGDICKKNSRPLVYNSTLRGFTLEFCNRGLEKTRSMPLTETQKV